MTTTQKTTTEKATTETKKSTTEEPPPARIRHRSTPSTATMEATGTISKAMQHHRQGHGTTTGHR